MGGFYLVVKLSQGEFVTNRGITSIFSWENVYQNRIQAFVVSVTLK